LPDLIDRKIFIFSKKPIIIGDKEIIMNDHTYNYDEEQPFAAAEFAENPEPRCPCVLLLDTSASMQG